MVTWNNKSFKDPNLEGIYVKRCKCGYRGYLDRTPCGRTIYWIQCENCDKMGESSLNKLDAIYNWNNNKLSY